jgi:hypothetical protein
MPPLNRFRCAALKDLRVGDQIRYRLLYQSRTGYLSRMKVSGTILTLVTEAGSADSPAAVHGLLRDRHGTVHPFTLTPRERVRRRAAVDLPATPVDEGRSNRGAGNVAQ